MDPREKVLRDYFRNLSLKSDSISKVEKVNLFPNADYLFLDMDRVIALGEMNKKFKDHYVTIDEFISRLLDGKFSIGSGMSIKLKELNDKVDEMLEEFEQTSKMEEDIIEEDITNLKEMFMTKVDEYFENLKEKVKTQYQEQNAPMKEALIEARKTLKEELLNVINNQEFFDKNKFFVEFDGLKKSPYELERFLKDYLNNEKAIQFSKTMDENIKRLSPVFNSSFNLEDRLTKYVLFVEKLDPKGTLEGDTNGAAIDRFIDNEIIHIDATLKKVKHFAKGSGDHAHGTSQYSSHPVDRYISEVAQKSDEKEKQATQTVPPKDSKDAAKELLAPKEVAKEEKSVKEPRTPTGSRTAAKGSSQKAQQRKVGEIPLIRFKNAQDLAFDYLKFADCHIIQASLELHGASLNQKSADYMGKFLSSVARIDRLFLNLSISSITKEFMEPLAIGLRNIAHSLSHIDINLSRSKIESEAFEILADALSSFESLKGIGISVEK